MRPLARRLSVATAWLDWVGVYFARRGRVPEHYLVGDLLPYARRPLYKLGFAFEYRFAPGRT